MTGRVRAARKRREGAAGVSSREAALEGHPGAVPLKAQVGGDGHPPLSGQECAGLPREVRWYHGVSWRLRPMGRGRHVFLLQ